jgi:hypothetical protein
VAGRFFQRVFAQNGLASSLLNGFSQKWVNSCVV